MTKYEQYEMEKQILKVRNLSPDEYERELKKIIKRLRI